MPRFSSGCPATPAGPLWCFAKEPVRSRVGLSRVQGIGDEYAASWEQDRVIKAFSQRIIAHCSGVGLCQSLPHPRREVFGVGPTYLLRTHDVILRTGRRRREFIHSVERGNQLVRLLRLFRKKQFQASRSVQCRGGSAFKGLKGVGAITSVRVSMSRTTMCRSGPTVCSRLLLYAKVAPNRWAAEHQR